MKITKGSGPRTARMRMSVVLGTALLVAVAASAPAMAAQASGAAASGVTAAAAAARPNLSGFWEPRRGSVKRLAPPKYTPAAQVALKDPKNKMNNPEGVDESDTNCLPLGQPWNLYQSAPLDIAQDDRETTMIYEDRSLPWHIYTDGRKHQANPPLTLNGDTIGWWEGDEFVVDSIGFSESPGHGALMMLMNNHTTHVVARFRLAAEGNELHAHFRVDDPQWLHEPFEQDVTWYRSKPDTYAQPIICDGRNEANRHF